MNQQTLNAAAIVVGFALVACTIYIKDVDVLAYFTERTASADDVAVQVEVMGGTAKRESNRHIYGKIDAPTTIVEFSDLECPYCARVHPTIKRIVDESDGSINWEYRHFPLPIHDGADEAALISECVSESLGAEAFWQFIDSIFAGEARDIPGYIDLAVELGVGTDILESCMTDPLINERVTTDMRVVQSLGGSGTPFSVIVNADGTLVPVRGALPYEQWQTVLP